MTLCTSCRRKISIATKRGVSRARKEGKHVGRPRARVTQADLARVRRGEITSAQLAAKLGCSAMTIRRRLRGL